MDYLTKAENEVKTYFTTHDIPTYFYQCLFGELVKIWSTSFVSLDNTASSYKDHISECFAYITGTVGWNASFKESCTECDLMDVYEYYANLDWVQSDIFDDYIVDGMMEVLFEYDHPNDYYHYKLRKANK